MKYAAAMRFGGQLVEAIACDYNDYKYLGLLCPECKDPVFLRAEGVRALGEKEIKISPHFSHFPAKDPTLAKLCEKRVAQYTEVELQKRVSQARGQRLKFFQRWFWDCFMNAYKDFEYGNGSVKLQLARKHSGLIEMLDSSKEILRRSAASVTFLSDIENVISCFVKNDFNSPKTPVSNLVKTVKKLDLEIHKQICMEAVGFLVGNRQLELFIDFSVVSTFTIQDGDYEQSMRSQGLTENCDSRAGFIAGTILRSVVSIPWSDEFAKVKREEACTLRQNPNPSHTLGTLEHAVDNFYEHGRP